MRRQHAMTPPISKSIHPSIHLSTQSHPCMHAFWCPTGSIRTMPPSSPTICGLLLGLLLLLFSGCSGLARHRIVRLRLAGREVAGHLVLATFHHAALDTGNWWEGSVGENE